MKLKWLALFAVVICCAGWRHGIGQNYYVNAVTGNDSNTGQSPTQAWKTIGKLNGTSLVAGTAVVNMQGSFNDACLTIGPTNAGSVSSLVIQPYGSGYTITANCSGNRAAAVAINGISNVTIKNGSVQGNSGVAQYGILVENTVNPAMSNVTIQGMTVNGFYCGTGGTCNTSGPVDAIGGEIYVRRFVDTDGAISNISILNNTLAGASVNAQDDNGIMVFNVTNTSPAVMTRANLSNITISGNLIYNLGGRGTVFTGNGILADGVTTGVVKGNVMHDNGANANACGGNAGIQTSYSTNNFTLSYNSVYNQQPVPYFSGCDWDAYDIDFGSANIIYEYNYAYNIYGACQLVSNTGNGYLDNIVRYNVYEQCGQIATVNNAGIQIYSADTTPAHSDIYNNTVYSTTGDVFQSNDGGNRTGVLANNIFYGNASGQNLLHTTGATGMTVINNDYFQQNASGFHVTWNATAYSSLATWQAAGGDANGVTTNPSLTNPGAGGACSTVAIPNTCPSAYRLQNGSAMLGTGLNLTSGPYNRVVGTSDYYGHTLPSATGTGYNFGADGRP